MTYDPHKKYQKVGECRRCGRCCDLHCPQLEWIALKEIKAGQSFESGIDSGYIYAHCKAWDSPDQIGSCTPDQRKNFPYNPWQTPPKCGFSWVEEG